MSMARELMRQMFEELERQSGVSHEMRQAGYARLDELLVEAIELCQECDLGCSFDPADKAQRAIEMALPRLLLEMYGPEPTSTGYRKQPMPQRLRKQVLERDAYRCRNCGDWHDLAVDHVYPESRGGQATLDNLQTLCRPCNSRKGNRV